MKLSTSRESLLKPLQAVIGVVERRHTMPILANVLVVARDKRIAFTATDLEVELVANGPVDDLKTEGEITVPGRKLLDICRALPADAKVSLSLDGDRLTVQAGRAKFVLSTLPAGDFPLVEDIKAGQGITVEQKDLARLINKTQFSMAQQDVRYYLNGLLLEAEGTTLRAVATDGHRLALAETELGKMVEGKSQVIVPRKGVLELNRMLGQEGFVTLAIGSNHIQIELGDTRFTSKLVDGRFPDYDRVIPKKAINVATGSRDVVRDALQRASILSNEKYRGVRLEFAKGSLRIQANNPDHEEAEDQVEIGYNGDAIEIGFNVNYLIDALGAVDGDQVEICLVDANSSCLIRQPGVEDSRFVVMPMRL